MIIKKITLLIMSKLQVCVLYMILTYSLNTLQVISERVTLTGGMNCSSTLLAGASCMPSLNKTHPQVLATWRLLVG